MLQSTGGSRPTAGTVAVLGGGVVGMTVAIELSRAGLPVTVLERGAVGSGASHGNAGMLVPSHSLPLARPSAIRDGLAATLGRNASLRVRPWGGARELAWLTRFAAACLRGPSEKVAATVHRMAMESVGWYSELASTGGNDFDLVRGGWLAVCETRSSLRSAVADAVRLQRLGMTWQRLDPGQVRAAVPQLQGSPVGGVLHPDDWVLSPDRLMAHLERTARELGVEVLTGTPVAAIATRGRRATSLVGDFGEVRFDQLVLAAGWETEVWLRRLGRPGGVWPGRGYSITVAGDSLPVPLNLVDRHVVVSTVGDRIRATSGLDLGRPTAASDRQRLEELRATARAWLPHLRWDSPLEEWAGARPMSANAAPLIGRVPSWENVLVASGHGMLGVTLAPATARKVRQSITDGSAALGGDPPSPR